MCQVDAAVRQTYIVDNGAHFAGRDDFANSAFNQISNPRSLLDPRACLCPHMKRELAAIGAWEEILSQPGPDRKDRQATNKKDRDEDFSIVHKA